MYTRTHVHLEVIQKCTIVTFIEIMDSQDLHLTVNINSDTKYPRVLGDFVHGVLHQCMGVVYMECYTSVWGLCTWSATPVYVQYWEVADCTEDTHSLWPLGGQNQALHAYLYYWGISPLP